jgi:hypothetical protein
VMSDRKYVNIHGLLVHQTYHLQTFFCGVIWKVKCTVFALQTYMHSKKRSEERRVGKEFTVVCR